MSAYEGIANDAIDEDVRKKINEAMEALIYAAYDMGRFRELWNAGTSGYGAALEGQREIVIQKHMALSILIGEALIHERG